MKIRELAKVVRSKNAGPFYLTLDILFPDTQTYEKVNKAQAITEEAICAIYNRNPEQVKITKYPIANAIKITIDRPVAAVDINDTDIYGTQQHAPLLEIEIPEF